jgi:hypothetical protein
MLLQIKVKTNTLCRTFYDPDAVFSVWLKLAELIVKKVLMSNVGIFIPLV